MLVLSRYERQSIVVPQHNITLVVLSVDDDKRVRIGIDAPKETGVFRSEVWSRIVRNEEPEFSQEKGDE